METFGDLIRKLREENGLPLRKVAANIDIDPSTLSKIERNVRHANKDIIEKFAALFSIDKKELLIAFLSDKVAYELINEDCSKDVLEVAEGKIKYIRNKNSKQGVFNF